jgi:alkanesulfonate monooxygenase SsuD/methylene tetrahydromethanopterin reductase-like flavin-dependent oxidoreductase (luciferase family)
MNAPVTFGINVNTRVPIIHPDRYSAADVPALAEEAERLGYDTVWVGDNFFAKGRMESLTMLGAIASRTSRVRLGTAAFILPLRHTVWLAIAWASLDQLSRGRMVLNVCVGGGGAKVAGPQFAEEFEVAGVSYSHRGDIMEEQIRVLRHLWSGEKRPFSGRFHTIPGIAIAPLPQQRPGPPIWISNNPQLIEGIAPPVVERMLRRVASTAEGWMTALATADEYAGLWSRITGYAGEAGRAPGAIAPGYQMTLTVGDTHRQAEAEAREFINRYYGTSYADLRESMWGRDPYGTPDDCAAGLRAMIDAGARNFALRFASRDQFGQVQRFTREVLPMLRKTDSSSKMR